MTDSRRPTEDGPSVDPADFVRFCYRRRRARWPELYDEMCAVASRGLYRGWGFAELSEHGIGFGLFDMPRLATVVAQVAGEEGERRSRVPIAVMASVVADDAEQLSERGEPVALVAAAGAS